jgi:hypothetical protein
MEARSSKFGERLIPELSETRRRFAVETGRYVGKESQTSSGRCHHCATWSCFTP